MQVNTKVGDPLMFLRTKVGVTPLWGYTYIGVSPTLVGSNCGGTGLFLYSFE